MLYDFIDTYFGEKLPDTQKNLSDSYSGPIYVFIGGLFNLAGYENGYSLRQTVNQFSEKAGPGNNTYFVQEKKETPWDEKVYKGYLFEKDGTISPEAEELANRIFLPEKIMQGFLQGQGSPAFEKSLNDLKLLFSRITLLGYSVGTTMIRQMETCIVQKLEQAGLSDDQVKSVVQCGVSLDIGALYTAKENEAFKTGKTLTHVAEVRRDDMMANRVGDFLGKFYYPERNGDDIVTTQETGNTLTIVPEIGSPTARAVTEHNVIPVALHYQKFQEAHSMLMYLNVAQRLFGEKEGYEVMTYPSLPSAQLIREFNALAGAATKQSIKTGVPRNGPALLKQFRQEYLSAYHLEKVEKFFREFYDYFDNKVAQGKQPDYIPTFYMPTPLLQKVEQEAKASKASKPATPQMKV